MREGEHDFSDSSIPGNRPVSSVFDRLGRFSRSKRDFEISEFLDLEIVVCGGELSTEYGIEADCSSCDDILPFRVRELWTVGLVNE